MRTEFGVRRRGGPATGVPEGHPARLHHVVARQGDRGLELLRVPSGGRDRVLPVFTAGWAARGHLFAEAPGGGWHVRACSPGELVSLLFGPCADVGWVALDPRPGHRSGALAANAMPRENFVDYLLCSRFPSSLHRSGFGTAREPFANGGDHKGARDVRRDEAGSPEACTGPPRPVRAFDYAGELERLRTEKTYEDHGRGVLFLAHEPSLRLALTAIAAGRRTGERRAAGPSTVQVLEGEVRFRAGEERHELSAGGTLVLQGNVCYDAEAVSDAVFLYTLIQPNEQGQDFPRQAHPSEPSEGRVDLDLPGADRASE